MPSPLFRDKRIISIINMSKIYNCRPSQIVSLEDEYTSYCFDEACAFIISKMNDGEVPRFKVKMENFSDIYKNL